MRKSIITATIAMSVFSGAVLAQDYKNAARDAQRQAWENAGMGIAIDAAGALVGAVVGEITKPDPQVQPQPQPQPQPGYAPQAGYAPAPAVVNPYYYPRSQACVTQRAPVYDSYGRVVEFVQYCANSVRR